MTAADQIVRSVKKVLAIGGRPHTTTGAWSPSTPLPATICSKSSKSDMAAARRPSPHNSPWTVGTKSSAIPHTRTRSWTASFTMLTESNSPAKACDGPEANRTRRVDHTASPMPEIHRPERLATRAASSRSGGRHHLGIPGGIIPLYPGGFVGIRSDGAHRRQRAVVGRVRPTPQVLCRLGDARDVRPRRAPDRKPHSGSTAPQEIEKALKHQVFCMIRRADAVGGNCVRCTPR